MTILYYQNGSYYHITLYEPRIKSTIRSSEPLDNLNPHSHACGDIHHCDGNAENQRTQRIVLVAIVTYRGEREGVQNLDLRVLQGQLACAKTCCHSEGVESCCIRSVDDALQKQITTADEKTASRSKCRVRVVAQHEAFNSTQQRKSAIIATGTLVGRNKRKKSKPATRHYRVASDTPQAHHEDSNSFGWMKST